LGVDGLDEPEIAVMHHAVLTSLTLAKQKASTGPQQQYKYVLEPGSEGKGKWVPVATGEDAAGQVKTMTQAEADALNKQ